MSKRGALKNPGCVVGVNCKGGERGDPGEGPKFPGGASHETADTPNSGKNGVHQGGLR